MPIIIRPSGDTDLENAAIEAETTLPLALTGMSAGSYDIGRVAWAPEPVIVTSAPVSANDHIATVDDLIRDNLVFDSGYLLGPGSSDRNSALIPIGGTIANDGGGPMSEPAVIQARALLVDGGETVWQDAGSVVAGATSWSGSIMLPRNSSLYRIQVRVSGSSQMDAMTTVCAVGHVLNLIGQSEHQRIGDANQQAGLTIPAVLVDGRVRIAWRPNTETDPVEWTVVSNTTPHSPAIAAMANALVEMRPNDHFTIIFQTKGATNLQQLANDTNTARSFSEDLDIINVGSGNQITGFGAVALDWTAGPGTWGEDYDQVFGRFFTKKLPDGTPMVAGQTYTSESGQDTITFDHYWADLDTSVPVLPYGPHRFETETSESDPEAATSQVFASAEFETDGTLIGPMALKRMTRKGMGELAAYDSERFLPKGPSPLLYRNGDAGSTIPWSDYAHPGKIDNSQGLPLWAQQNAYIIGQMMGWQAWTPPVISAGDVTWDASGAFVDIDIGQTLSTVHLAEGGAELDVAGFEVSGRVAPAVINNGTIRVSHPDGTFSANDTLRFGMGGASGVTTFIDDIAAEIWKKWPMMPMAFTAPYDAAGNTNPGIALEPVVNWDEVFANPLALPAGASTVSAGTSFIDNAFPDRTTTPWSGASSKLTMEIRFEVASGFGAAGYHVFMGYGSLAPVSLSVHGTNGRVRTRFGDDQNASGSRDIDTNAHEITWDADTTLTFAVDLSDTADGKAWLRDGAGALLWSASGLPTNGTMGREVYNLLPGDFAGTLHHAVFWNDCTADGAAPPLADAYRIIAGPAALLNAHDWKQGADVT